jgi:ABC-type Fe3+ transport system substrate-binding protein
MCTDTRSNLSALALRCGAALCAALTLMAMTACDASSQSSVAAAPEPSKWLTIVTPHNEDIRERFQLAFSDWYAKKYGRSVYVDWVVRGTPECVAYVEQVSGSSADSRTRADVMFGGGITDHQYLAARKLSAPLKLDQAHIPAEVAGVPTRDPQGHWFATGLSSFGIVFNETQLSQRGIAPPQTWADLADPRFAGWVGVADPLASGSHLQCMILMLQKEGWPTGWGRLIRVLANSRALVERSSTALQQTQTGVFLATFAVNFDGLMATLRSAQVKYVDPAGATAVTPDVISALRCASDPELAADFVRFTLSEPGQTLWGLAAVAGETPLFHYPIDPTVYEKFAGKLSVRDNPFKTDFGLRYDLQAASLQARVLPLVVAAACRDNHVLLQQAWSALQAAGMPEAALKEFTSPPFDAGALQRHAETIAAADPKELERITAEWSAAFAAKYRKVRELAKK